MKRCALRKMSRRSPLDELKAPLAKGWGTNRDHKQKEMLQRKGTRGNRVKLHDLPCTEASGSSMQTMDGRVWKRVGCAPWTGKGVIPGP